MNTNPQTELSRLREEISKADQDILDALAKRQQLTKKVALLKAAHGIPVHNHAVEEAKLV